MIDTARLNAAINSAISQQDRADTNQQYLAWKEMQAILELARDELDLYHRTYETSAQALNVQPLQSYDMGAFNPRILEQQVYRPPGRPKAGD